LSENIISISGPGPDLTAFKERCSESIVARFAHVHAYYHGGEQMCAVVNEVMGDLQTRMIGFPSICDLKMPLRSTVDGSYIMPDMLNGTTLAEYILHQLLVHPVRWTATSKCISASIMEKLNRDTDVTVRVLSFGPSSSSLLQGISSQPRHSRLHIDDLSSVKPSFKPSSGQPSYTSKDDIAIVGMAVNFPKGNGIGELWHTLSTGLNAVEEVCISCSMTNVNADIKM
jgi:hypothetical protein